MSKAIASLLFVSGLCVAPIVTGVAANMIPVAYTAGEEEIVATSEEDEDIAYVDPGIIEEMDAAEALESGAPITGFATDLAPVVEITYSNSAPITGVAVAEEPDIIETVAKVAVADEPVQAALETTDMANLGQKVSSFDEMQGKLVMDRDGDLMGTVVGVNDENTTLEVELTDGRMITLFDLPLDLGNGYVFVDRTDIEFSAIGDPADLLRVDCQ